MAYRWEANPQPSWYQNPARCSTVFQSGLKRGNRTSGLRALRNSNHVWLPAIAVSALLALLFLYHVDVARLQDCKASSEDLAFAILEDRAIAAARAFKRQGPETVIIDDDDEGRSFIRRGKGKLFKLRESVAQKSASANYGCGPSTDRVGRGEEETQLLLKPMSAGDIVAGLDDLGLSSLTNGTHVGMTTSTVEALRALGVNAFQEGRPIPWSIVTNAESDVQSARLALARKNRHTSSHHHQWRRSLGGGVSIMGKEEDVHQFQATIVRVEGEEPIGGARNPRFLWPQNRLKWIKQVERAKLRQEEEEGFCGPFPLPENTRGLVAQVLSPDFRAKWETERCHMGRVGAASEIQAPSECSCFLWMKECYALGTHPEIVQAVKETTGLSELVLHKMDLMELPPGGMEAFHVDIETADCQADAVVLVGLPMLAIAPPVGVAQSLLAMAAVQAVRGRAFFLKGQASSRNFLEKALLAQLQRQGVPNLTVSSVLNGARDMAIFRSATWHAVINPTNKTRRAVAMRFASPTCSIRSMLSFSLLSNKTEVQRSSITPPVLLVTKGTTTVTHGNNSEDNDVRRWRSFQGEMPSSPLINHMPHHRHHHHDDHDEDRDDGDDDRDRGLCRLRQGGSPPRNETWGAEFLMRAKTRRSSALFSAEDDETTSSTDLNISSTLLGRTDIVAAVSATIISCSKRNKVLSPLHFHEEGELIFVLLGKIVALKFSHMDSRIREKAMVTNGSMLFLPSNTLHMIVSNDNYTKVVSIRWRPHRNHDHDDDGGVQQPTGSLTQQQQKQQVDPHCSSSRDTPSSPSHYQGTQVGPVRPHFHQRCIKGLGGISAYSYRMLPERALDPGARQGYDVVVVPLSGAAIVFPEGGWIKEHMVGLVPALTSHVLWNPKKASKIFNSTSFMLQEDDNNSVTMLIVEIHAPGIRVLGGHDDVERFVGAVMLGAQFDHMRR